MNITLNTNNFNSQYQYKNNQINKNNSPKYVRFNGVSYSQPSFNGNITDIPAKSKLLDPFKKQYDKFTTWLSKNYTEKLYNSKVAAWLAKHSKKLDGVVDHMQVIGSTIISGMYMVQTLRNKQMDEDRKRTLAVNQGLTFAFATLGSYVVDRSLDNWWEKVTVKYAQKQTGNENLGQLIKDANNAIISKAEKDLGKNWKNMTKKERPQLMNTLKYIEDNLPNTGLESRLRGMGVLKKLIIFGSIYRFIVPVAVTPFANKIGNKLVKKKQQNNELNTDLNKDKSKETQKA